MPPLVYAGQVRLGTLNLHRTNRWQLRWADEQHQRQPNGICQRRVNNSAKKIPSSVTIDLVVLEKISKFVNAFLLFRYLSLEEGLGLHQGMPCVKFGCNISSEVKFWTRRWKCEMFAPETDNGHFSVHVN